MMTFQVGSSSGAGSAFASTVRYANHQCELRAGLTEKGAIARLFLVLFDPRKAALRLECSMSQLVKLIKDHMPAFERWNKERAERGLHAMH